MKISFLEISNLRNLKTAVIEPCAQFNVISGENGSGKTSLLEAIYLLGFGRSFRSHLLKRVIAYDTEKLNIFSKIQDQTGLKHNIGYERSKQGDTQIRIDGETSNSLVNLARLVPLQFINHESHNLLDAGPQYRRRFIDWGVFHVEQLYYPLWQRTCRTIKQRNAALRERAATEVVKAWDKKLVEEAVELHQARKRYLDLLLPYVAQIMEALLGAYPIELSYYPGWDENKGLLTLLEQNIMNDYEQGYTHFGPQRADIKITVCKTPVQDFLSRGQQKLLVSSMRLAQGKLLKDITGKQCIYLIDDLPAELDAIKRQNMMEILVELQAQVFITTITQQELAIFDSASTTQLFHVEHGQLRQL